MHTGDDEGTSEPDLFHTVSSELMLCGDKQATSFN